MNILKIAIILLFVSINTLSQVRFFADFESGNLSSANTTDSITYTVTTKTDIGGRWFYFKVTGVKNKFIRIKISNSDVKRAMYSYDNVNYSRFTISESPSQNTIEKTYARDSVFLAYYTPYTLLYLKQRIAEWVTNANVHCDTLGYTNHNLPLYELTVTDRNIPDSLKEHIWIHARTHPSETPSSWHFDGFMKKLLSGDEVINHYLKKLVFHCIPFTNPDGVFYGRSRTNYDGIDVESNWNKPDSLTSREVLILKQRMLAINGNKVMKVFLNLHSQAAAYCTFWIHTASSTSSAFYRREMQFCNLNISDNAYFKKADYSFSNLSMTFPEGWQWSNWGDKTMALTYETPYDYYSSGALVDSVNLAYLGERTLYSIAEYLELNHDKRMILDTPVIANGWGSDTTGTDFYGKDYRFLNPGSNPGSIIFGTGIIPSGKYDVYAWWPANAVNADNVKYRLKTGSQTVEKIVTQKINGAAWNLLGSISLQASGEISVAVSDSASGRIAADAIRVIYTGAPQGIERNKTPANFALKQNYPNPFNASSIISYSLQNTSEVKLTVYNTLGQEMTKLVNEVKSPGSYEVRFNAGNFASEVYYYRLQVGAYSTTRAMVLLK